VVSIRKARGDDQAEGRTKLSARRRGRGLAAALLLAPLLAMRVSNAVRWEAADLVLADLALFAATLRQEFSRARQPEICPAAKTRSKIVSTCFR
jgi:hypothetical protein